MQPATRLQRGRRALHPVLQTSGYLPSGQPAGFAGRPRPSAGCVGRRALRAPVRVPAAEGLGAIMCSCSESAEGIAVRRVAVECGSDTGRVPGGSAAVFGVEAPGFLQLIFEQDDAAGGFDGGALVDEFAGAGGDA